MADVACGNEKGEMTAKLTTELDSFQDLWDGGFFEGDPLDPLAKSGYGHIGFISTLHATYLRCIKPYVNANVNSLEIGPGRGAWTRALLPSREVYALDALSAEHNKTFEYLGHPTNLKYFQVGDFSCDVLPDDHFDYMFSFGCLCHVSFEGIREYAKNLYPKLRHGSNCFWMVGDYAKYNAAIARQEKLSVWRAVMPTSAKYAPLKTLFTALMRRQALHGRSVDANDEPVAGRWYDAGIDRTAAMLTEVGYKVVDADVGTCLRDPIIHFIKE